jgi:methyl-accepting chemotaxis protein
MAQRNFNELQNAIQSVETALSNICNEITNAVVAKVKAINELKTGLVQDRNDMERVAIMTEDFADTLENLSENMFRVADSTTEILFTPLQDTREFSIIADDEEECEDDEDEPTVDED